MRQDPAQRQDHRSGWSVSHQLLQLRGREEVEGNRKSGDHNFREVPERTEVRASARGSSGPVKGETVQSRLPFCHYAQLDTHRECRGDCKHF